MSCVNFGIVKGKAEVRVFEKLVEEMRAMGLIQEHGKQRSDSLAMLTKVRQLSRIELVVETLRLAVVRLVDTTRAWSEDIQSVHLAEALHLRSSEVDTQHDVMV